MLVLPGNAHFYLCQEAVDLRKSFEGLSAVIAALFPAEITSGAYFIFLNRSKDRMKVLYWDSDGLAIWYKRLEQGSFSRLLIKNKEIIDRREFLMLLEGITPKKLQKRFKLA
jgi:transposase